MPPERINLLRRSIGCGQRSDKSVLRRSCLTSHVVLVLLVILDGLLSCLIVPRSHSKKVSLLRRLCVYIRNWLHRVGHQLPPCHR